MPITYLDEKPQGKITYLETEPQQKESILPTIAGAGAGLAGASGLAYGASKVIPKVVSGVKNLPNVLSTGKQAKFSEGLQGEFSKAHSAQVKKFGNSLNRLAKANPTASIDLSEFLGEITNPQSEISSQALSVFKKTPKLADMIKNQQLANAVSIRDAQDIINHLNTKIPKNIKANNFDIIEAVNTIKGEQLQAFPKMAKVREAYASFIGPYKNLKRYFGFNKTIPAVEGKVPFGGSQGWEAAKKILPKETIKNIKGYRYAKGAKEVVTQPLKPLGRMFGMGKMMSVLNPISMLLQAVGMKRGLEQAKKTGMYQIGASGDIIPVSREDLAI